jgi:hypothetical protein
LIISDRFGFAFVHIPKCAGSTVREQIQRLDPDSFELAGRQAHPELGKIDAMHLPLDILREHFPDVFARLRATHSYALTRDPRDRFRSSVSEYLKTYHHKRLSEFDAAELRGALDEIMAALAARPPLLPLRYVHFTPQERYVRLDGETVISRRYALEDIGAFFADLGRRTGASFDAGARANQDFAFRFKGSERWLWRANQTLKEVLPYAAYQGVKRRLKPLLVREKPAAVDDVFTSAEVRDFVREFYAADIALHQEDRRAAA